MPLHKIGFTGTSKGMTSRQSYALHQLLMSRRNIELHQGDCIGADAEANSIARSLNYRTVAHPPTNPSKRAFAPASEVRVAKPYLERNRDIVNDTDILVAAPDGPERLRSGTWATVRYARKLGRSIIVINPDGSIT